jgi:hypothetical protein
MCTASRHLDSTFQMSPVMEVTGSSGQSDRHTEGIFKSCVLQHPGNA